MSEECTKAPLHMNSVCLICNGKKNHYDFSIENVRVEECANCGMMRLNPQPSDEVLGAIYSQNYFLLGEDKEARAHFSLLKSGTADRYLDQLQSYTGGRLSGSLLEVGCGLGDFLVSAAKRGLSVSGVEYSPHAVEVARSKLTGDAEVICGEVSQLLGSEKRYDFIVAADVLEHVREPREFLKTVYSLLNKGGIIMIIVPSIDSFTARLMKNKWMEFKLEHLWYFSQSTLGRLIYSENFGEHQIHQAKKTLSFDYIAQHFERYPVQPYLRIIRMIRRLLPGALKSRLIHVNASGIVMMARKQEIKATHKLSVIMAVYNEEKTVKQVIDKLLLKKLDQVEIELIIVESNSTDKTAQILRQYVNHERVKLIWQEQARGKGNAIRAGLAQVSGDFVLIQDADDEYDFEDYDALIEPLISGEAAFVLGARHGGKAWKMRQFSDQRITGHILNLGHWFFTLLVNVFFGLRLKDPFTMYKVFRTDCLRGLKFECDRFDFDFELLIKLVQNGYKPIEIPVNYRSRSFKEGKKVRVIRDPLTWLRAIVKFRLKKEPMHG